MNRLSKKRILLVTTSDRMAGAEKNIVDLLTHLDRNKYEPRVVVFKSDPNGQLVARVKDLGVSAEIIGIESKLKFYRLYKLWKIIRAFRPDILESFLFFDNQVCRIFGTMLRVPYIISGQQNVETKRPWWRNLVDRITIRYADRVISNTDAGGQWYINHGYISSEKVCIAKNGVDIEKLQKMQQPYVRTEGERMIFGRLVHKDTHALVSVGFLTEQKGIVYLLDALKILKNESINVESFIVGNGELKDSLIQEAHHLGVDDIAHFVGFQQESYQYMALFDAFVMPSLWEGLPNVLIEAMASNIPAISTAVGGVSEVITNEETGFLIEPGDSKALADAIRRLVTLPNADRKEIIKKAFSHIKADFSVQSMVASYENCYEELLNKS